MVYQLVLQLSFAPLQKAIAQDLGLTVFGTGIASASFLATYGLMQIPAGALLDRAGPRVLLVAAVLGTGACGFWLSHAGSLAALAASRAAMGVAAAFAFPGAGLVARRALPAAWFALAMCVSEASVGVGGALGAFGADALDDGYGWRSTMRVLAALALPLGALVALAVRVPGLDDRARRVHAPAGGGASVGPTPTVPPATLAVLRHPAVLRAALVYAALCGTLFSFGGLWAIPLQTAWGWTEPEAVLLNGVFFVGVGFGAPAFGLLAVRLGLPDGERRALLAGAWLALAAYLFDLLAPVDWPLWFDAANVFLIGAGLGASALTFPMACAAVPVSSTAAAVGFVNCAGLFSAVVLQVVPGAVLAFRGDESLPSQQLAQAPLVAAIVLAVVVLARAPATSPAGSIPSRP